MNSQTKTVIWIFAGLGALWDIITTFSGMYEYAGHSVLLAIIMTFFINGVIVLTFMKIENVFIAIVGMICLLFAFLGDFTTAFNGNLELMQYQNGQDGKYFIAVVMTIITVACSLTASYLIFRGEDTNNTRVFHQLFTTEVRNKHMCKHLIITPEGDSLCGLLKQEGVPLQVKTDIGDAFKAAITKNKPDFSRGSHAATKAKSCQFHNSPYAIWNDCPQYKS